MPIFKEILVSTFSQSVLHEILISTVAGFLISLIADLLHMRLPDLSILFFWKTYAKRVVVVTSELYKPDVEPQMRPGSRVGLMNFGEALAAANILHFFRSECKSDPSIITVRATTDFDRIKDGNIFLSRSI